MKVKNILERKGHKVYTTSSEFTVEQAAREMAAHNVGGLVVVDENGVPSGIITERDILKKCFDRVIDLKKISVEEVMSSKIIVALPEDNIGYIMGVMTEKRIRHMPVIDNHKLVGIISIGDVVKAYIERAHFEIHYLQDYITGKYPG